MVILPPQFLGDSMDEKEYETREFIVQEVIDAIKVDGLEHLRGQWIDAYAGKLYGGCVLGQGAINLGVLPDINVLPAGLYSKQSGNGLVYQLNQFRNVSPKWSTHPPNGPMIVVDADFPDEKEPAFYYGAEGNTINPETLRSCGDAIITWNDLEKIPYDGDSEYALATYEEVAQMAADILAPYANEKITLTVIDYSEWKVPA